tara:strand:- start:1618 stop:2730 length:1113 start_codon:yes stop_codon:yes gene_type:complete
MKSKLEKYNFLINTSLIFLSVLIPLGATDILLKYLELPKAYGRVIVLGGGYLKSKKDFDFRAYSPNSTIRHSNFYGNVKAFDQTFKTNKYGFRITSVCDSSRTGNLLAITGDSFTEGHGSEISWSSEIQKISCKKGFNSINLAVGGNGVIEMLNSLRFAQDNLGSDKALVAITSSDIERFYREMRTNPNCSSFVFDNKSTCNRGPVYWHIPLTINNEELNKFVQKKYNYGILSSFKLFIREPTLKLKKFMKEKISSSILNTLDTKNKYEVIKESYIKLNNASKSYGINDFLLLILPNKIYINKNEILNDNNLNIFLNNLNRNINIVDLRYCPLKKQHFIEHDGHLNADGQRLLGKCASADSKVREFLDLL